LPEGITRLSMQLQQTLLYVHGNAFNNVLVSGYPDDVQ